MMIYLQADWFWRTIQKYKFELFCVVLVFSAWFLVVLKKSELKIHEQIHRHTNLLPYMSSVLAH